MTLSPWVLWPSFHLSLFFCPQFSKRFCEPIYPPSVHHTQLFLTLSPLGPQHTPSAPVSQAVIDFLSSPASSLSRLGRPADFNAGERGVPPSAPVALCAARRTRAKLYCPCGSWLQCLCWFLKDDPEDSYSACVSHNSYRRSLPPFIFHYYLAELW